MSDSRDEPAGAIARDIDDSGLGPMALAAMGSVLLALYYYYVRGDRQRGQFVGLWPPTILGLAAYLKLGEIKQLLDKAQ